ncbi:hypothetical protein V8E36_005782 [Tilletia maclaganii]
MSGPSRLPLEALKHGSRAVSPVVAGSTITSHLGGPGQPSTSLPFGPGASTQHRTSVAVPHASGARATEQEGSSNDAGGKDKVAPKEKTKQPKWRGTGKLGDIMHLPVLLSPLRVPRNPIVLCHGLYGFDVRGPFLGLEIHYWAAVMDILRKKLGAKVIIRGVPGTGSIQARAEALHKFLCSPEAGLQGQDLNLVGHSMGGLDARHLISNIRPRPEQYRPVSLTTICTPHRGSPFMDWCNANIGIGNDAIEEALREVKNKRRRSDGQTSVQDEYQPPPYSLKSPLFVRQKKNGNGEATNATSDEKGEVRAVSAEEQKETTERIVQRASHSKADARTVADSHLKAASGREDSVEEKAGTKKEPESKASAILGSIGSAFTTLTGQLNDYMLSILDTPAYAMLSTKYMSQVFNPSTPDDPKVKYFSIAARTRSIPIWHPLWLPKLILDAAAESRTSGGEADGSADALGGKMQGNDGLVSVQSAQWGEFLGIVDGCDHWDLRGGGGPRLADRKLGAAAAVVGKPDKSAGEKDKSWVDVNQLLGLWRALKPSSDKGSSEGSGRPATDGVSTAHGISTLSASQQQHQQSRPTVPLESLQSSSSVQTSERSVEAASAHASEAEKSTLVRDESVTDIVQTFMHAYSHLADPKHEESDYDWTAAPSFTPTGDQESIITEIAQWISERLPQRDEGRRAAAEKEAAAQDQEIEAHERDHEQALSALGAKWSSSLAVASSSSSYQETPSHSSIQTSPSAVAEAKHTTLGNVAETVTAAVTSVVPSVLSSSQPEPSSHSAAGPQYRIRHKDEEEDADKREDAAADRSSGRVLRDVDELELFWVAVCHHLYARGF